MRLGWSLKDAGGAVAAARAGAGAAGRRRPPAGRQPLADAEQRPDRDYGILVTDPDSLAWGRLAAALAVGAHLAVGNGVAWNTLGGDSGGKELLERDCGITDADGWREQMNALLVACAATGDYGGDRPGGR
ncbi:hypothetical protein [Actinomadura sp. BRA 177]|uniref:hypothetical protein n=1 Tax=Actinomadura sp. BRA 177 TaxID=2745202 RepID=UPI001595CA1F|nr:hypothetical protein [Actinomadura sp. BRA 177]NVI90194.1 hypothetical protein [Actinomadura sp. BRA 177]